MTLTQWIEKPMVALAGLALGMGIIPLNDAIIKLLSDSLPLSQIIVVRALLCIVLIAMFSSGIRSTLGLSAGVFWSFVGRAMCLVVAMAFFFVPLGSLPLPTVVSIFFVSPLLITLLSVPFLGEKIGIHRAASVVAGMIGVLLIVQPGSADFQPETLLVIFSAFSYAVFQVWTRRLKSVGNLEAMVTVQHLCYLAAGSLFLIINWVWPTPATGNPSIDFLWRVPAALDMTTLLMLAGCAFAVLFLSMASSNAYRVVEASLIAPFEYTAIPLGVFWGIVIWGDWPEPLAWVGMALILGGGLYAVARERVKDRLVIASTPMPASAAMAQNPEDDVIS